VPDDGSKKILRVAVIATVVLSVLAVCAGLLFCFGPFALFAWFTDQQMDWYEEQSGTAPFVFG
jgi:hypothetical protein